MALNFPSSPTNGQSYIDDNGISWIYDGVKWNVSRGTTEKAFSGAKVTFSSNVALTSTNTAVSFSTESFDTDSYFTLSDATKISINKTAFYRINFSAYSGSIGSSYTFIIKKNGSTNISSVVIAPNQYTNYDEILQLQSGDYLQVYAAESSSLGELVSSTVFEITRVGLPIGTNITPAESFSGARGILTTTYSTTASPTAVSWDSTLFNQNANSLGDLYWDSGNDTRFTIGVTGYYQIRAVIVTGALDNYNIAVKKNGSTTLTSSSIGPNSSAILDEIYYLADNDYIELYVDDGSSTGTLTTSTYFEIIRVGV